MQCLKTPNEDSEVLKFLKKPALLKSFQDWTRFCTTDILDNLTTNENCKQTKLSKNSFVEGKEFGVGSS